MYASQGYDTANLILSAMQSSDINDKDAFRAAIRAAQFDSVRGNFRFGNNQHPIQDTYVREVVMQGDVLTNKIIDVALKDHQDAYAAECAL